MKQVDVWDVVDKGKKRIKLDGLKLTQSNDDKSSSAANGFDACLDAEFLDVYQGCFFVVQGSHSLAPCLGSWFILLQLLAFMWVRFYCV